ncbi:MAG: hypothetical protein KF855_03250 [Acidobacteria bacterium]|nr:hypothetical protein [Acidobacteriota bacterium]
MVKHVVNLSGGACSFWAAHRVAEKYGTADMTLLFADTLIEDQDLYDFNDWTANYFNLPITRVSREMTPWQLFRKEGMIGNNRAPICSIRLKREPLDEWFAANTTPRNSLFGEADIAYVGLDWTEGHRLAALRASKPQWEWAAPMCEWLPVWDKNRMLSELKTLYGKLPKAYEQGFPHNNCGRRCVRAGITHFVRLYKVDPQQYADWEWQEELTRREFFSRGIWGDFAVLKDRRGKGKSRPMTFAKLKGRILANDPTLPKSDWGGCGCGVEDEVVEGNV